MTMAMPILDSNFQDNYYNKMVKTDLFEQIISSPLNSSDEDTVKSIPQMCVFMWLQFILTSSAGEYSADHDKVHVTLCNAS